MHLYSMPRSKLAVSRGTKSLGSPWSDICHMLARNHIQYRSIEFPVSQSLRESNPQDPYALHLLRVLPVLWVAMTICTADLTLHHILSCAICIKGSQESSGPSEICHGWPRWWFHPIDKMPHDASMIWLDKLQFPQGGQQLRHFSTAPWPSMACITRVTGGFRYIQQEVARTCPCDVSLAKQARSGTHPPAYSCNFLPLVGVGVMIWAFFQWLGHAR